MHNIIYIVGIIRDYIYYYYYCVYRVYSEGRPAWPRAHNIIYDDKNNKKYYNNVSYFFKRSRSYPLPTVSRHVSTNNNIHHIYIYIYVGRTTANNNDNNKKEKNTTNYNTTIKTFNASFTLLFLFFTHT